MKVTKDKKYDLIKDLYLLTEAIQTVIFVNTRKEAENLKIFLSKLNKKAEILIGGIEPKEQDKIIDNYRKVVFYILIC